jgi:hypothetical protein
VLDVNLQHLATIDYGADLADGLQPSDALTRFSRRLLDTFLMPKTIGVTRLLAIEVFRHGSTQQRRPRAMALRHLPEQEGLREYLGRAGNTGRLRVDQPDVAARQLVGMLLENTFNRRLWGHDVDDSANAIGAVIESSVRVFLDHYEVKPTAPL